MQVNKTVNTAKEKKRLTAIIKTEIKLVSRKKDSWSKFVNFWANNEFACAKN